MSKKLLASILVLVLVLGMLPTAALAAAPTPTVVVAPSASHPTAETEIKGNYGTVRVTQPVAVDGKENTFELTLTGTNMISHYNAEQQAGYWVGFGMPIDGATGDGYTYKLVEEDGTEGSAIESVPGRVITEDGKSYNTIYFDEAGTYTIKQSKTEGATITYVVTVDITPAPISVVPANLTAVADAEAPMYGHAKTYTATLSDSEITINATCLTKTRNTKNQDAYWVGVGLLHQEGATYASGFGEIPESIADGSYEAVDSSQEVDTKTYDTIYWGKTAITGWDAADQIGYISVKVGGTVTNYTVKFNVEVAKTVTIYLNPGYGSAAATTVTSEQGQVATLTAPDRTNYSFEGWTTIEGGTTPNVTLVDGNKYTVPDRAAAAINLYAVWSPVTIVDAELNTKATVDDETVYTPVPGATVTVANPSSNLTADVTISGDLPAIPDGGSSYSIKYYLSTDESRETEKYADITLSKAENTISVTPETLTPTGAAVAYTVKAGKINEINAAVEVSTGSGAPKVDSTITDEETAETVVDALGASTSTLGTSPAIGAALAAAAAKITDEQISELLPESFEGEDGTTIENKYTKIEVVSSLDIVATNYTEGTESEPASLTVNITPVIKYFAIAEVEIGQEAVPPIDMTNLLASNGTSLPTSNLGDVSITIGLPVGFVVKNEETSQYPKVYVTHKGYVYEATVGEVTNEDDEVVGLTATFTNPHGFSTFVVTAEDPAVAQVGATKYTTLQEAVNAVEANGTVTILKAVSGDNAKVTANKTITFALGEYVDADVVVTINNTPFTVKKTPTEADENKYTYTGGGGGGYVPSNPSAGTSPVTVNKATNGKVSVNPQSAAENATVTITATPDEGYIVNTVAVVDKDGKYVTVTKTADGKYTFKMPKGGATVSVTFKKDDSADMKFTDVKSGDWFYNAVKYAYDNKLMDGISATTFNPSGTVSRVQVAQVIYNMNGRPSAAGLANPFSDVKPGQWYTDAVLWCSSKGYMSGYGDGKFGANDNVTREQLALVFMNVMGGSGRGSLSGFTDADQVDSWALAGVEWAVANGIISGKGNNMLDPRGTAMRSELAQILMKVGAKVS